MNTTEALVCGAFIGLLVSSVVWLFIGMALGFIQQGIEKHIIEQKEEKHGGE